MLDYHLHLWPHSAASTWFQLDQIAQYCDEAARHGVSELALTEHANRFVDVANVVGPWWLRFGHEPTSKAMAAYWDFHARSSLEAYVELAQRAKDEGLPVKIGLEVDYQRGQMDEVSALLAQYPFDVLIGSVHWIDAWAFDDLDNALNMGEWSIRDVEKCWDDYTVALEELAATGAVDVLAHPDLIKVAGHVAASPGAFWDRMSEAAAKANVSVECSSAGWFKPVGEQYPAQGFLDRLVKAGVTFTTASDAHRLEVVSARVDDVAALLEARGVHELASYEARVRQMVPMRMG
ncbi:MAG TPA: histidinol-phosphatase [Acidimicrobiales bacterium]|nr:histidinol-phosphatase [Acidimicrobiales bacterium]